MRFIYIMSMILSVVLNACNEEKNHTAIKLLDTAVDGQPLNKDTLKQTPLAPTQQINTGDLTPDELISFAKTLIGTPYLYGSTDPAKGFDCSGFITYVFNHFNIAVPRSSIDFTTVNTAIPLQEAQPGDLILFTGTDSTVHEVGHMGIIVTNGEPYEFIHSTSGKKYGVTITPLNGYYLSRFVKIIRVFHKDK